MAKVKVLQYANRKPVRRGDTIANVKKQGFGVVREIQDDGLLTIFLDGQIQQDVTPKALNLVSRRSPKPHTRMVNGKKVTIRPKTDNHK